MNYEAGISKAQLAMIIAKCEKGSQKQRLKKAWKVVHEIDAHASYIDSTISDDLGICPNCLEGGWLIAISGAIEKCMNCGTKWLVLEG